MTDTALATIETVGQQVARIHEQNSLALLPAPIAKLQEIAEFLAASGPMVPKHFRGNVPACFAVAYQAARWQMDPVAVAGKAYLAGEKIGYEAQLVASIINTRSKLVGRLDITFKGEGQGRYCIVGGRLEGATKDATVVSPVLGAIKPKNSPLWHTDPDQQLAYYTQRAWARRHCPEALLGVYTDEEVKVMTVIDVTPKQLARAFDDDAPEELEEVEGELIVEGEPEPEADHEPSGGHSHKGTADSQGKGAKDIGPDLWSKCESVEEWYADYMSQLEGVGSLDALELLGKQAQQHGWFTRLGQAEGKDGPMKKALADLGKARKHELSTKEAAEAALKEQG